MSDTNPKHTPTPWQWDGYDLWHFGRDYNHPDDPHSYTGIVADKRLHGSKTLDANMELIASAVNSHAALKARCAELEAALTEAEEYMSSNVPGNGWGLLDKSADADRERVLSVIRALLSPRDGEAEPEYCAHCNRIDVPGYHQSDCPAADDGEAK